MVQQLADLAEIRRRYPLVPLIGKTVKLRRTTSGAKGLCPFHKEGSPSFHVDDNRRTYRCYGCGERGSVFDWVMHVEGCDFAEAIRILDTGRDLAAPAAAVEGPQRVQSSDLVGSSVVGRWLWQTAVPARGTIVEAYLASRGLPVDGLPGGIDALRFHPRAPHIPWRVGATPGDARVRAPAMIAGMADTSGAIRGVHATYLRRDGSDKADLSPDRKMWGPLTTHAVWLAGSPAGDRSLPLVTGEGIETVWAFVQHWGRPCRAAAALSLDNLQGFPLTPNGVLPLWNSRIDPERRCFTLSDPGDVIVLVDADMKPLRDRKVQLGRGKRPEIRTINRQERAKLCADLATQQWRRAGARQVEAVRPPLGMDFNDLVRGAA
ncbi:DUF7146 domain-containing protein [Sphingomonas sp. Leaf4]|uniref:DUF7146 domain-containing protein n=1 Tax=Sphingomonas sp. Leaf4 TaxID=2876553 RepID=UPI001E37E77F|nr:CHC2 zinc finger domain-containing protein [Sphingomonas sp. Leaf4]